MGLNNEMPHFALGVEEVFRLNNTEDMVVVGRVEGAVSVGDAVYLSNPGMDHSEVFVTIVKGIETKPKDMVQTAKDCNVGLKLENLSKYDVRCGSVVHTRSTTVSELHNAYCNAIGNEYIGKRHFALNSDDFNNMSLTDSCTLLRLHSWFISQAMHMDETTKKAELEKEHQFRRIICNKLMRSESIYCLFSTVTQEPYLFSETVKRDNGYEVTPPHIRLFTESVQGVLGQRYPEDRFHMAEIKNTDGKNVENFLGGNFYMNGACGVMINDEGFILPSDSLVAKPDFSNIPEIQRPIMNPDVERWLLLIAQLGKPDTGDKELIYKLYYGFLSRNLVKARFLVPMKHNGDIPEGDENGKVTLQKDTTIQIATMQGKSDRQCIKMYTDWNRLHQDMGNDWNGMIQTISDSIEVMDCAINVTKVVAAGCYIDKEMYQSMLQNTHDRSEN